ncbi:MAG: hypothetical protein WCS94_10125 [Verrucomicrobiota bacterium]
MRLNYSTVTTFIQSATVLPEQRQQFPLSWLVRNSCNGQVLVYHDGVQGTARPAIHVAIMSIVQGFPTGACAKASPENKYPRGPALQLFYQSSRTMKGHAIIEMRFDPVTGEIDGSI